MPQNQKSPLLKCRRCNKQGHLVKNCTIPRRRKERQTTSIRSKGSETLVSLASSLEVFMTTPIKVDNWEIWVKQMEQQNPKYWDTLMSEPKQQSFASPLPKRREHQASSAGSSGSEASASMVLPPHELEQQNFNNRWETVHFIFRGWNEPSCKTRKQNPKYYDTFFICGQYDHHSHSFCKFCKTMTPKFWPNKDTPCDCLN